MPKAEHVRDCTTVYLTVRIFFGVQVLQGLLGGFLLINESVLLKPSTYSSFNFLSETASFRHNIKWAQKPVHEKVHLHHIGDSLKSWRSFCHNLYY